MSTQYSKAVIIPITSLSDITREHRSNPASPLTLRCVAAQTNGELPHGIGVVRHIEDYRAAIAQIPTLIEATG